VSSDDTQSLYGLALKDVAAGGFPALVDYLARAWQVEHGIEFDDLEDDFDKLQRVFQSHVSGKGLRDHVKSLGSLNEQRPYVPEPLIIAVASNQAIVTPEGRVVLEASRAGTRWSEADDLRCASKLAVFYGESLRGWISRASESGLLPTPSAGFVVFLMINGSVGPERAMRFPNNAAEETELAEIVMGVASSFSEGIGGPAIGAKERMQLRTSWVISQATRHLGRYITRGARDSSGVGSIWLEEPIAGLVDALAVSIKARGVGVQEFGAAFEAALSQYEHGRQALSAWRIGHERQRQTDEIRSSLELSLSGS
jgi:hypothetical protein